MEGGKGKDKHKARKVFKESHCQLLKLFQFTLRGVLGASIKALKQKQREGALHDCSDPRTTGGEKQSLFFFPQRSKIRRRGKFDNNNFLHL